MAPIERHPDWLVVATKLVLLHSGLMVPASLQKTVTADYDDVRNRHRLRKWLRLRAAAAWLETRPQLERGVPTMGLPEAEAHAERMMVRMEAWLIASPVQTEDAETSH